MTSAGVVEPVDVLEDSSFRMPSCRSFLLQDQFSPQRLEERLGGGVVIGITLAADRWTQSAGFFSDKHSSNIDYRDQSGKGSRGSGPIGWLRAT
jgi:hypothetical protein